MGVDGMKCPVCVAASSEVVETNLTGAAGPMPGQLLLLLILMGIDVVLDLVHGSILGVVIGIALILGIVVGNNGVRKLVIVFAWIGLIFSGLAMVALLGANAGGGFLILGAISIGIGVFTIWTLSHSDVRDWMFKTAFKDGLSL